MPASDAANDTKPSAPLQSTPPRKTRRMKPQLLVLPLAQYPTPASRKYATAPKLPRTLSVTSIPCLPNPHRLSQSLRQSQSNIPSCPPMPFGPPTPLWIQAPAQPWSIPSSEWATTANSGLKPPNVKLVALLKANSRTCPLAATRCTSWITATFLQPRIYASLQPSRCTRSKPHPLHRWRRPHRLQRQSQHSYGRLRDHQASPKQHRVHPKRKNAHCRH